MFRATDSEWWGTPGCICFKIWSAATCRRFQIFGFERRLPAPPFNPKGPRAATSRRTPKSGNQLPNHLPPELRELLEPASMEVGQLRVVETQEVQDRDVQITDVMDAFKG